MFGYSNFRVTLVDHIVLLFHSYKVGRALIPRGEWFYKTAWTTTNTDKVAKPYKLCSDPSLY